MFKKNKWQAWYDAQPKHIQNYIDQDRAIWYDSDMWKAGIVGLFFGIVIGLLI